MSPLLKVDEVAEHLRCDKRTVYRLIRSGDLTPAYIGGRFLFTPESVEAYVAKRTRTAPQPVPRRRRFP